MELLSLFCEWRVLANCVLIFLSCALALCTSRTMPRESASNCIRAFSLLVAVAMILYSPIRGFAHHLRHALHVAHHGILTLNIKSPLLCRSLFGDAYPLLVGHEPRGEINHLQHLLVALISREHACKLMYLLGDECQYPLYADVSWWFPLEVLQPSNHFQCGHPHHLAETALQLAGNQKGLSTVPIISIPHRRFAASTSGE